MLPLDFIANNMKISLQELNFLIIKASIKPYTYSKNGEVNEYLNQPMIAAVKRLHTEERLNNVKVRK